MILLPALVCAGLAAGCGGGLASGGNGTAPDRIPATVQSDAVPAPRTLTPDNDGRVYTMKIGQTAALVVPDPNAPDPVVDGGSVEVIEQANITASGRREWELRARSAGRTTLRAAGARPYTITLDVR